jgi:molybdenum cofactor biosynthesis protein B
MGHHAHKKEAGDTAACAIITASDTRDESTDESGRLIRELLEKEGHRVVHYRILKDEPTQIVAAVRELIADQETDAIIVNGGTGIARRDSTFEAIDALLEKRLPGFGELFRYLSYLEIGSAAMLSRATAGIASERAIFSVPGSVSAVRLAMEKLILPELNHIVWLVKPERKTSGKRHGTHSKGSGAGGA